MTLRIAFDLDGVLADMESELVRHAEILFGEAMTERLQERAADGDQTTTVVSRKTAEHSTQVAPGAAAAPIEGAPPLLKLNMTSRQQRKLWKRIEAAWGALYDLIGLAEPG